MHYCGKTFRHFLTKLIHILVRLLENMCTKFHTKIYAESLTISHFVSEGGAPTTVSCCANPESGAIHMKPTPFRSLGIREYVYQILFTLVA